MPENASFHGQFANVSNQIRRRIFPISNVQSEYRKTDGHLAAYENDLSIQKEIKLSN